jgi:ribose 5-phosphate isomerase A
VQRADASGKPYVTDEGHHILDCHFGKIPDPAKLACTLSETPGVVEHGLFVGMANVVLMAKTGAVEEFKRP